MRMRKKKRQWNHINNDSTRKIKTTTADESHNNTKKTHKPHKAVKVEMVVCKCECEVVVDTIIINTRHTHTHTLIWHYHCECKQ